MVRARAAQRRLQAQGSTDVCGSIYSAMISAGAPGTVPLDVYRVFVLSMLGTHCGKYLPAREAAAALMWGNFRTLVVREVPFSALRSNSPAVDHSNHADSSGAMPYQRPY